MLPLLYNNNYEIAQSKDTVAIVVEMVHDVRIIRIGGKHRTDGERPWMGDSIGWYEGPTLVVETTNFPEATALRGAWKELKVTERFTRVATDIASCISSRSRIRPCGMRPWSGEYEFSAVERADFRVRLSRRATTRWRGFSPVLVPTKRPPRLRQGGRGQ